MMDHNDGGNGIRIFSAYQHGIILLKIDLTNLKEPPRSSASLSPVSCGKFGYMMIEHDVWDGRSLSFDPDNDNPIIIVGTFR